MSPDPVGFVESNPMSFNRYAYVNNNPYKYVDPDGEFLNFAAKFVLDVGVNIAFNYVTTGEMDVGGALKDSAIGILNPAKTVAKVGKLASALSKVEKKAAKLARSCCFVAGTQVLTESGYKNIEDVQLGERLWAKNVDTGEQAWKPVTHRFVEPGRGIYEIKLTDGVGFVQTIEATDDHPFWVLGQGWKTTVALIPGDRVETDGSSMSVLSITNEGRLGVTYNFTVADFHTYYVTERNVLVHNCNPTLPIVGGGASLDFLTPSEIKRIQNAANRTKQEITVVGSRARGTAGPASDWDYIFHGKKSRQRHSAMSSVPRGTQGGELNAAGIETGIDRHSGPVSTNMPHITFQPK